eukprot:Platyproteum_vivax@DN380_c0_g1_i1.p1
MSSTDNAGFRKTIKNCFKEEAGKLEIPARTLSNIELLTRGYANQLSIQKTNTQERTDETETENETYYGVPISGNNHCVLCPNMPFKTLSGLKSHIRSAHAKKKRTSKRERKGELNDESTLSDC